MVIDTRALSVRLAESLAAELEYSSFVVLERLAPMCESPIEALLGAALLMLGGMIDSGMIGLQTPQADPPKTRFILTPQFRWRTYRIDWHLRAGTKELFVECDGHDFHERTKEQAERDRSRDREITTAGIPFLRFTGREIHRDAAQCANEVANTLMRIEAES